MRTYLHAYVNLHVYGRQPTAPNQWVRPFYSRFVNIMVLKYSIMLCYDCVKFYQVYMPSLFKIMFSLFQSYALVVVWFNINFMHRATQATHRLRWQAQLTLIKLQHMWWFYIVLKSMLLLVSKGSIQQYNLWCSCSL